MRNLFTIFLLLIASPSGWGQSDIAVGSWRTHNAYNRSIALANTNDEIIVAVNSAIYTYNPASNSSEQITSITGLSDAGITSVGYNEAEEIILVTYENGNIDLISNAQIRNFPDLLLSTIAGSKRINHIYNSNEFAYLSADFGVMIIDLAKNEVKESFFELGVDGSTLKINSATILNDTLYLATEDGVIGGNLKDNLKDFNNWRRYGIADGVPEITTKVILQSSTGLLTVFDEEGVFEYNNGSWADKNMLLNKEFKSGSSSPQGSLIVSDSVVYKYSEGILDSINSALIINPMAAIHFSGQPIVADNLNGLILPDNETSFYPDGPFDNQIVRLFGYENKMIALPPAYSSGFVPLRNQSGFFLFEEGEWSNYNSMGYPNTNPIPEFYDITDAMYSYASKKLYLSSFGYGIMEFNEQSAIIYDETNSSLTNSNPAGRNVLVSALDANSKFLSVVNFNAVSPYHSLSFTEDNWQGSMVSYPGNRAVQIRGFENNTYWLQALDGIIVFDKENSRELRLDNALPSNSDVFDMAIDREGKMWVATEKGVYFFYNAESILDQSFIDPVQPIYDGQILFRNEKITALAVDGGNRIWMATTTGLWLFASDGQQLIYNFNTENSPLPSNGIIDLSINHQSGEVFIATDKGLVSFRGTATIAKVEEPLKIFPNPVIRSSHDIVTIQGVPDDANFTITDSAGRLVYKSRATGNTAIWQGISSNSELSSGVYLVFVTTEDGSEKQVGKIALIN